MVTKLEIVKHMLFTVGEQVPVTLESQHPSIIQALAILDSNDRDIQGRGWWYNTENSVTLAPDTEGAVIVPNNTLSLQVIACHSAPIMNRAQYTVRASKIYDTIAHTYNIGGPLLVNVVTQQPIEDIPHNAGTYLKHLAAESMFTSEDGDQLKMDRLKEKTALAWHLLKAEEFKTANINALNSPTAAQLRYRIGQVLSPSNPMWPGGR